MSLAPLVRVGAFALALAVVFATVLLLVGHSPAEVRRNVDAAGAWAPVLFVVLAAALTCAFFPFPVQAVAAGLLFGAAAGTGLSLLAATIGASLAFLIARRFAAPAVAELGGRRLEAVQAAVKRRGFVAVLYARIFPGVPRDLANYVFGLTHVGTAAFLAATLIGTAPRAYAYTALGGTLGDLDSATSVIAVGVLAAMGLLGLVLVRRDPEGRRLVRGLRHRVRRRPA